MIKRIGLFIIATMLFTASQVFACGGEGMAMGGMKMEGGYEMMMGKPSIVASNDGGVIILMGHKLYKYDKNLNLIKEVELKMDMPDMKGMKKDCPMCQKMMNKDHSMNQSPEEKKTEDTKPVDAGLEHQEHH